MITVLAGPDNVPFNVYHDILCERSAHFRTALQSPFTEAHSGRIAFPDEQPYTIKLFLHWVYTLNLPACQYPTDLQSYVALMSFARSILLEELQNACMDSIRLAFTTMTKEGELHRIGAKDLVLAYETPELRKFQFFMCFEAALQVTSNHHRDDSGWMDEQLTQLLEQGGDLAVDLPKLLVHCSAFRPSNSSGMSFTGPNWRLGTPMLESACFIDGLIFVTDLDKIHYEGVDPRQGSRINPYHTYGSRSQPLDNSDDFPPGGFAQFNWAYGDFRSYHAQAESSAEFQASTLLPGYNCLFHEHHGAATCSSKLMEDTIQLRIVKAWQCFSKKPGSRNT